MRRYFFALWPYLLSGFIIFSVPFVRYPFTDADCLHWIKITQDIHQNWGFLTGLNDQAHGPLLSWMSAIFSAFTPHVYYMYGLFNILIGLVGIGVAYGLAESGEKGFLKAAPLAAFMATTALATVYLSHTPMYDWPAAVFFGLGCLLFMRNHPKSAALAFAVGTLSRFSIILGLASLYIALFHLVLKTPPAHPKPTSKWKPLIMHLSLLWGVVFLVNFPWWWGQFYAHGPFFISQFIFDNVGRYIHEAPNAPVQHDYYGFMVYAFLGIFPYSAMLLSLLQRSVTRRVRDGWHSAHLVAMWLPCLVLFSLSGHIKLGRYIAYIFIPLIAWIATEFVQEAHKQSTRKLVLYGNLGFIGLLSVGLGILAMQFRTHTVESPMLIFSILGLALALGVLGLWVTQLRQAKWIDQPAQFLGAFVFVYTLFFSVLGDQCQRVPFLRAISTQINTLISR